MRESSFGGEKVVGKVWGRFGKDFILFCFLGLGFYFVYDGEGV